MPDRRVALVTGASRGIGRATALQFAATGYDVAITALEEDDLNRTAAEIGQHGAKVLAVAGDLSDLGFAESMVQQVAATLGAPHALVNNAAWREIKSMREISLDSWEKTLRVCITAPAFLSRWVAETMEPLGRGAIVNISSIMAATGYGLAPAYVAAKGALDALTYELAALYGPAGIRVLSVRPGAVDTLMSQEVAIAGEQSSERTIREWSEEMISLRRWASAEEIARTIVWLAGEEASYLTGTTITVDGGWSRQLYPHHLKHSLRPGQFPHRK
jgi:3-oxoacyl-[acyl-carrier protein] reductase